MLPNNESYELTQTPDFGKRNDLKKIDDELEKIKSFKPMLKALREGGHLDPGILKRIQKDQKLRKGHQVQIAHAMKMAIYDIPTEHNGYILNAQLEPESKITGRLHGRLAGTVLPWAEGGKQEGPMYLCMDVDHSKAKALTARLRVIWMTVGNKRMTVLITSHVCDRIRERAGISGSPVAFMARSIAENGSKIAEQPKPIPLLTVFGLDHKIIGYCPIERKRCALQRVQDALHTRDGKDIIACQDPWRLKTFLLPEHFASSESGKLIPNRAK
jgi:hypothetical protein